MLQAGGSSNTKTLHKVLHIVTGTSILLFLRFLRSSPSCGRRGRKWIGGQKNNSPKVIDDDVEILDGRIVKDGRNPFRTVGGIITQRNEIPWQVK